MGAKQKAALAAQLNDVKALCDNEARERGLLLGKYRNLEHELDGAREALDEEAAGRENTLRLCAKAEAESQCWRQKYETDAVAKGEELEMTRMKLTTRLTEAEAAIDNLNAKLNQVEKAKGKIASESNDMANSLDIVELGSQGSLLLGQDVQVVVKVSNDAEKVRVLNGNLVLGGCKVTESQVGIVNLLVDGVETLQHGLVGLVGGGLSPHDLVSGSAGVGNLIHDLALVLLNLALHFSESINLLRHLSNGIALLPLQVSKNGLLLDVGLFHILAELVHLCVPLLVKFNLGSGGTAGAQSPGSWQAP